MTFVIYWTQSKNYFMERIQENNLLNDDFNIQLSSITHDGKEVMNIKYDLFLFERFLCVVQNR